MEIPDYSGAWTARGVMKDWINIAASADGRVIVAAVAGGSGGELYTSWDYGVTWTQRTTGLWWYGLASSADGSKLVGVTGNNIYTSWDSGATWTPRGMNQAWGACAASADGTRMVATWDTDLYVSTDSGATWTSKYAVWNGWGEVAMSADGMTIASCATIDWGGGYYVMISHDGGETFTNIPNSGNGGGAYSDVVLSADGAKIAACVYGGRIWTSADSGATWIARENTRNWSAIDMSADGTKLVAHDHVGYDYFSIDSGLTWTPGADARNIPTNGMVMSADGTRVACVQWGGNIYTMNTKGATVAQTPAGTTGYISGEHYSAVELQYEGSNTFRVLTHEKARPYQTVTQPELALALAAKANASDLVTHTHDGAAITTGKIANARLNTGSGNGLDADQLDGQHASAFATSGHNHDTAYWRRGGNAGTTPGTHYVGTSDNQALELKVNGARALRLEPNATSPNMIGGYSGNSVPAGVYGATIAGGGESVSLNTASATYATVSGGVGNTASATYATVSGGVGNTASATHATVSGGGGNTASAPYATVSGGFQNRASGYASFVAGGIWNIASGNYSFAGGGTASATHDNSFAWNATSERDDQVIFGAYGGVTIRTGAGIGVYLPVGGISWLPLSDRNMKENFEPVSPVDVLEKVATMPVTTWTVIGGDPTLRYMGPMAQDFYAAFGLGNDETRISTIDADGVALAAIQGVNQKLEAKAAEQNTKIAEQNEKIQSLESRIARLEALVEQLTAE